MTAVIIEGVPEAEHPDQAPANSRERHDPGGRDGSRDAMSGAPPDQ